MIVKREHKTRPAVLMCVFTRLESSKHTEAVAQEPHTLNLPMGQQGLRQAHNTHSPSHTPRSSKRCTAGRYCCVGSHPGAVHSRPPLRYTLTRWIRRPTTGEAAAGKSRIKVITAAIVYWTPKNNFGGGGGVRRRQQVRYLIKFGGIVEI